MSWTIAILTYVVVWCLVLQAVLPFGVTTPVEIGEGHDHGAPDKPHLWLKMLITTLIAVIVTALIAYVVSHSLIDVRSEA